MLFYIRFSPWTELGCC